MEIVLKDRDGNDILSPTLTQWDQGVPIEIRDFYYNPEFVFLHFYNATKQAIYSPETQFNATAHTITAEVPNQLLREAYPITVHVYKSDGGSATDPDEPVHAQTVFTATINVEPRMRPDDFEEIDNAGAVSARQVQEDLGRQIAAWEDTLIGIYGTTSATPIKGYFDENTQKMYSDAAMTQEIVGIQNNLYVDATSDKLYTFSNGIWSSWDRTIVDAVEYCKARADICDNAAASMHTQYGTELNTMNTTIQQTFADALDGCVVRLGSVAPTAASYSNETSPVITFVIAEA